MPLSRHRKQSVLAGRAELTRHVCATHGRNLLHLRAMKFGPPHTRRFCSTHTLIIGSLPGQHAGSVRTRGKDSETAADQVGHLDEEGASVAPETRFQLPSKRAETVTCQVIIVAGIERSARVGRPPPVSYGKDFYSNSAGVISATLP